MQSIVPIKNKICSCSNNIFDHHSSLILTCLLHVTHLESPEHCQNTNGIVFSGIHVHVHVHMTRVLPPRWENRDGMWDYHIIHLPPLSSPCLLMCSCISSTKFRLMRLLEVYLNLAGYSTWLILKQPLLLLCENLQFGFTVYKVLYKL